MHIFTLSKLASMSRCDACTCIGLLANSSQPWGTFNSLLFPPASIKKTVKARMAHAIREVPMTQGAIWRVPRNAQACRRSRVKSVECSLGGAFI